MASLKDRSRAAQEDRSRAAPEGHMKSAQQEARGTVLPGISKKSRFRFGEQRKH